MTTTQTQIPRRVHRFLEKIADGILVHQANEAQRLLDAAETRTLLDDAVEITVEIEMLRTAIAELKRTFAVRELEGGVQAAFTHPVYLAAEKRIAELQDELTMVI